MIKGKQSIAFNASPYIEESASVVGKKEGEGPLGKYFDIAENLLYSELELVMKKSKKEIVEIIKTYCEKSVDR